MSNRKQLLKKIGKVSLYTIVIGFALYGFLLTAVYFAVKLKITNDPGGVDKNDRVYQELAEKDENGVFNDSTYFAGLDNRRAMDFYKIMVISKFYPVNANLMLDGLLYSHDASLGSKMITAIEIKLGENQEYLDLIKRGEEIFNTKIQKKDTLSNCFVWMNVPEWTILKHSIIKDKALIDSAAKLSGVEPRLIVCCLIGEQIRLFNSKREVFKSYIAPNKVLSVENQFSLGVTGIKDFTGAKIERCLKDSTSEFYIHKKFEKLLDYPEGTTDFTQARFNRLVDYRNHFYSYLYTGLFLHQVKVQWERANFDISDRPEILTTLFNVGYAASIPKADPKVGGSHIEIGDKIYTFGAVGFDFYYSGELAKEFPYEKVKFKI